MRIEILPTHLTTAVAAYLSLSHAVCLSVCCLQSGRPLLATCCPPLVCLSVQGRAIRPTRSPILTRYTRAGLACPTPIIAVTRHRTAEEVFLGG